MKKKCLMAAVFLLATSAVNAQTQKDFIRNYKAPDFKLRSLIFSMNGDSRANNVSNSIDTISLLQMNGNGGLTYYEIKNSAKYQGTILSKMTGTGALGYQNKVRSGNVNLNGSLNFTGRFYLKNKFFVRTSSAVDLTAYHWSTENELTGDQTWIRYSGNAALALGYGRVEYSNFARKAMDIEFLLKKADRIEGDLTASQLTEIADNLARITYRRGFDNRLLRIWRLEQIDSIIGGLNFVSKRDMRYMAFLNDAMQFSPSSGRLSGSRIEAGVGFGLNNLIYNAPTYGDDKRNFSNVFVQYASYIPTSYAFQHNVFAGFDAERQIENMQPSNFEGRLFGRYQLGWYPNTRTSILTSAIISVYDRESVKDVLTFQTGLDYYYYITPRSRLSINSNMRTTLSEENSYFSQGVNKFFALDFRIGFTHAIF